MTFGNSWRKENLFRSAIPHDQSTADEGYYGENYLNYEEILQALELYEEEVLCATRTRNRGSGIQR